jgi:hypothetical protein
MEFRKAFNRTFTDLSVDRTKLRQRYISTNGEGRFMVMRQIARPVILFAGVFVSCRMFVGMIVVVRMGRTG